MQHGISTSRAPSGAEVGWGWILHAQDSGSSCVTLGHLQHCSKRIPGSSACARHFAGRNVQFSALLKLAAGIQTPSVVFSLVPLENLRTSQLFSRLRAICVPAVGFKAICTSPRNHKPAVVLTLLVLGAAGSVERDKHRSSAKRKNSQTGPNPFPAGLLVQLGCWERLTGPHWFSTNSQPSLMGSDGVGRVGRSCRPEAQIQIPAAIGVPGCPLAPRPPPALGRLRAGSGASMALRNPAQGSWEPLPTLSCTLGMGSMASEGPIKPQLFRDPLIHPRACPCQQTLWLSPH